MCKPFHARLAELEENAINMLEEYSVDESAELAAGFNIRVNADIDSVESWFTYRVFGR